MGTSSALCSTFVAAIENDSPLRTAAQQLVQLNRQYLVLLAADELCGVQRSHLGNLSNDALAAIADCPFSLFTLNLHEGQRWSALLGSISTASTRPRSKSLNSLEQTEFVAAVIFFAWHLTHSAPLAAKVLLDMDTDVERSLRSTPIACLPAVADSAVSWLKPRWPQHDLFWPTLVRHANKPNGLEMRSVKLLGRQLLAAEAVAARSAPRVRTVQRTPIVRANRPRMPSLDFHRKELAAMASL